MGSAGPRCRRRRGSRKSKAVTRKTNNNIIITSHHVAVETYLLPPHFGPSPRLSICDLRKLRWRATHVTVPRLTPPGEQARV